MSRQIFTAVRLSNGTVYARAVFICFSLAFLCNNVVYGDNRSLSDAEYHGLNNHSNKIPKLTEPPSDSEGNVFSTKHLADGNTADTKDRGIFNKTVLENRKFKMKPRVNILTDPSYRWPVFIGNLAVGVPFFIFILLAFIYDAVVISREARRTAAVVAVKKKAPSSGDKPTFSSTYRSRLSQLIGSQKSSSLPQTLLIPETMESCKSKDSSPSKVKSETDLDGSHGTKELSTQTSHKNVASLKDPRLLTRIPEASAGVVPTAAAWTQTAQQTKITGSLNYSK